MSQIDRHVGRGDEVDWEAGTGSDPRDAEIADLRRQLDEARTIHASEVRHLADQVEEPPVRQRKALAVILDSLGYSSAAAVVRAGVTGGYFVVNPAQAHAAVDLLDDAAEHSPTIILFCDDLLV